MIFPKKYFDDKIQFSYILFSLSTWYTHSEDKMRNRKNQQCTWYFEVIIFFSFFNKKKKNDTHCNGMYIVRTFCTDFIFSDEIEFTSNFFRSKIRFIHKLNYTWKPAEIFEKQRNMMWEMLNDIFCIFKQMSIMCSAGFAYELVWPTAQGLHLVFDPWYN